MEESQDKHCDYNAKARPDFPLIFIPDVDRKLNDKKIENKNNR